VTATKPERRLAPKRPARSRRAISRRRSVPQPCSISDDRLIDRLHHSLPEFFLVGYLCFLVYASLLPFGSDAADQGLRILPDWSGMTTRSAGLKDILPNILLYVPLGAGVYVAARRRGFGRTLAVLGSVAVGTGTSAILELLQQLMPLRISSWVDLASNAAGGLVGALLGRTCRTLVNGMFTSGRFELRHKPFSTTARAYIVVLILAGVIPLDFTYDMPRLGRAVKNARLVPFSQLTAWQVQNRQAELSYRLPGHVMLRRIEVDFWLDMAAEAAAFGLAGILITLSLRREHHAHRFAAWVYAGLGSTLLAFWLSGSQFFIMSRGFDASAIVVRALAATLCAWVTARCVGRRSHDRDSLSAEPDGLPSLPGISPRVAQVLLAAFVLYVFCRGFSPFLVVRDKPVSEQGWGVVNLIPLSGYFFSRVSTAADDIFHKVLRYAVFGGLAALAVGVARRGSYHWRALRIAVCAALISTTIELAQTVLPTRFCDLTHVLLAAFGGYAGAIAARWLHDYYHAARSGRLDQRKPAPAPVPDRTPERVVFDAPIPPPDDAAPKEGPAEQQPSQPARQGTDGPTLNVDVPPPDEAAPKEPPDQPTPTPPTQQDGSA